MMNHNNCFFSRPFFQVLVLFLLVTIPPLTLIAGGNHDDDGDLPNIVLIISDDQSWTDYGFMGHPVIQTPCLDRLARQGMTFGRGYVPTSLCRPSLATIITGLYPAQHFITGNDLAMPKGMGKLQYEMVVTYFNLKIKRLDNLPSMLAKKGYLSFQSGKWWEGSFQDGGFTHGMTHGIRSRGGRHGDEGLKIGREGLKPIFDFIDQAGNQPFFVWYAPFLPHAPHNPPARFLEKYNTADRPIELAKYYAMCSWFDETCGQLVDYIDQNGLGEKTLVLYVADNGWIQRTPEMVVPEKWNQNFAPEANSHHRTVGFALQS